MKRARIFAIEKVKRKEWYIGLEDSYKITNDRRLVEKYERRGIPSKKVNYKVFVIYYGRADKEKLKNVFYLTELNELKETLTKLQENGYAIDYDETPGQLLTEYDPEFYQFLI